MTGVVVAEVVTEVVTVDVLEEVVEGVVEEVGDAWKREFTYDLRTTSLTCCCS